MIVATFLALAFPATQKQFLGGGLESIRFVCIGKLSHMALYRNPFGIILLTALEVLPIGFLVALISSLVLKKTDQS